MLLTLSIIGTLTVTTVVIGPRMLDARSTPLPASIPAATPAHQQFIDDLAGIIERSVGVLAIHQRGPTPYLELVLWLHDDPKTGSRGEADVGELAVLSHSAVLRTITIYRLTGAAVNGAAALGVSRSSPEFCERWRAQEHVVPLVLARGISDVQVEPVGLAQDEWVTWNQWGGLQRLRLALTWAADSADGPDEASVLVHTVMFPDASGNETTRTWEASEKLLGEALAGGGRGDIAYDALGQR